MDNQRKKELEEKLTGKQLRFCKEYVLDWNATRAAKEAGYSEKTAQQTGSENLLKPFIQEYINLIKGDYEYLLGISKAKVVNEHIKHAFDELEPYANKNKALESIAKLLGYNNPDELTINQGQGFKGFDFLPDEDEETPEK